MADPVGSYARRLGLFSGTMLVVGGIIGSGIFLNPAIVAQRVATPGLTLGVWVLGGVIAAVAVTFANYAAVLLGLGGGWRVPLALGAIVALTAVNYVGVKPGAITQNVFTLLKLAVLALLVG